MNQPDDPLRAEFHDGRRRRLSLDEQRAKALLARRLFGADSAAPVMLGRFEVHERLGSGGLGVVYRAWDPVLEREAAVKVLRADAEADAAASAGARVHLTESRRVARLNHPGIVRVFDSGVVEADAVVYVVMEFISGGTLEAWLEARPRSVEAIAEKFHAAALALEAAHAEGIVHRDFKPSNVLLDADERVRVVDFGTYGTEGYMAPEVVAGALPDARADVYALCVSLRRAFEGRSIPSSLEEAIRSGCEPAVHLRFPSIRPIREALVLRRSRRGLLAAALVAGVGVGAFALGSQEAPCAPPTVEAIEGLSDAAAARADRFLERWDVASAGFCERGAAAVQPCLETMQRHWSTVRTVLLEAPASADVLLVLDGLPDPTTCGGDDAPTTPPTPLDASFRTLRLEIESSQSLGTWAQQGPALLDRVRRTRAAALASGNRRVEAGATLYLAIFEQRVGHVDEAEHLYESASVLARRAEDFTTAFRAEERLAQLHMLFLGNPDAADRWMTSARDAAAARSDSGVSAALLMAEGRYATLQGRNAEAIAFFDDAEVALEASASLMSVEALYAGRGQAKLAVGDFKGAVEDYERVLEALRDLSEDSLVFTYTLQGLGGALVALGRLDEAEAAQVRLRDIMLAQAPDSPDLAAVRFNLAAVYSAKGEHAAAVDELLWVRARFEDYGGPEHEGATAARAAIAEQYEALGDLEAARREAEAALRWNVPQQYAGAVHLVLARADIAAGRTDDARDRLVELRDHPESSPEAVEAAISLLNPLR